MDKSKVIGGIICLVLAALLAVLNFVLPPDRLMFMVGGENIPFLPAIILAVVGIGLLATARRREQEIATEAAPQEQLQEMSPNQVLNKRLETIGWGLFLIMLGGFALVPHALVSPGVWSIGVGLIMLGLNVTRYFYGIKMSGFTTLLGILSLFGGIAQLLGFDALEGALFFIILGAYLIFKPWFDKRQLFGKVT